VGVLLALELEVREALGLALRDCRVEREGGALVAVIRALSLGEEVLLGLEDTVELKEGVGVALLEAPPERVPEGLPEERTVTLGLEDWEIEGVGLFEGGVVRLAMGQVVLEGVASGVSLLEAVPVVLNDGVGVDERLEEMLAHEVELLLSLAERDSDTVALTLADTVGLSEKMTVGVELLQKLGDGEALRVVLNDTLALALMLAEGHAEGEFVAHSEDVDVPEWDSTGDAV
jgi:hypothetical protein